MKSSVIFGAKVVEDTKVGVKESLGIDTEGGEGFYLRLPKCFSGSKRKILKFLRERLQGRIQGWFSKSLSQRGTEILLKSVCFAIMVFAMSCFKFPKDVCAKIISTMIEFWWSGGDNQKRISWVAWKKLCKPKDVGGLGFRNIELSNHALLGKQAWRIWNMPDSLLAQVLKHHCFPSSEFLSSSVGTRPSYAWCCILHGRDMLK